MIAEVETLQHPWELAQVIALFKERCPMDVLEIGVWQGGTLQHWMQPGVFVVAVDDEMRNATEWHAWAQAGGVTLELIQGKSQDPQIVDRVRHRAPYDWIFIDADHTEAAVRADWENYRPMLAEGGVFVFHDICGYEHGQVDRLWADIKRMPGARTVEYRQNEAPWGGIGVFFK